MDIGSGTACCVRWPTPSALAGWSVLRTAHQHLQFARDIVQLCRGPDAILLNYTNPMCVLAWLHSPPRVDGDIRVHNWIKDAGVGGVGGGRGEILPQAPPTSTPR